MGGIISTPKKSTAKQPAPVVKEKEPVLTQIDNAESNRSSDSEYPWGEGPGIKYDESKSKDSSEGNLYPWGEGPGIKYSDSRPDTAASHKSTKPLSPRSKTTGKV